MIELIVIVIVLISVSFLCSILEAVILSVTRPYIQSLLSGGKKSGKLLHSLKDKIDEPISAILTLNTISHTVGATIAGAMALSLFGSEWMAVFSSVLTLLILILSEIIPKTLGAYYWKPLGPASAYILRVLIFILKPLIIPVNLISGLIAKKSSAASISRDEIINFIRLGYFQGTLQSPEYKVIENLFRLDTIRTRKIMTPRTVVFWIDHEWTVETIIKEKIPLQFSRIPLYDHAKNIITGIVMRREIMDCIASKKNKTKLSDIAAKPGVVVDSMSVYRLLDHFISQKQQLSVVVNEYGDYVGIVTMEDAIETLLGVEIVDEFDTVEDMQKLAGEKLKEKYSGDTDLSKPDSND